MSRGEITQRQINYFSGVQFPYETETVLNFEAVQGLRLVGLDVFSKKELDKPTITTIFKL